MLWNLELRMPDGRRVAASLLAAYAALLTGCGEEQDTKTVAVAASVIPPPERTAVKSSAMRSLMTDLVASRICEQVRDRVRELRGSKGKGGGEGEQKQGQNSDQENGQNQEQQGHAKGGGEEQEPPVAGRLWLDRCSAFPDGQKLRLEIAGRGFRYIDRDTETFGAEFKVDEYVRFSASFQATAEVDFAYDEAEQLAYLWLAPTAPVQVSIEPLGEIDVRTPGVWSSFLGGTLSALPVDSLSERADSQVSEKASKQAASKLAGGYTMVMDVCSGTQETEMDLVPQSQMTKPPAEKQRSSSKRIRLYPGGFDIDGPHKALKEPLVAELTVESGPGLEAEVVCMEEAEALMKAYVAGGELPTPRVLSHIEVGADAAQTVRVAQAPCEFAVLTRSSKGPTEFTLRIVEPGDAAGEPSCQRTPRGERAPANWPADEKSTEKSGDAPAEKKRASAE